MNWNNMPWETPTHIPKPRETGGRVVGVWPKSIGWISISEILRKNKFNPLTERFVVQDADETSEELRIIPKDTYEVPGC
jgi:hypothetical protein